MCSRAGGNGIGSVLNNIGYIMQELGLGRTYYWEANYIYATRWE